LWSKFLVFIVIWKNTNNRWLTCCRPAVRIQVRAKTNLLILNFNDYVILFYSLGTFGLMILRLCQHILTTIGLVKIVEIWKVLVLWFDKIFLVFGQNFEVCFFKKHVSFVTWCSIRKDGMRFCGRYFQKQFLNRTKLSSRRNQFCVNNATTMAH